MNESYFQSIAQATKERGEVTWKTPSNIALVKYWGKKANQIPANPSISFTLDTCSTITRLEYLKRDSYSETFDIQFFFENSLKPSFLPKIEQFFERIFPYMPFLKDYKFVIHSANSFPHSSGIASSASGMGAMALCLMSLEKELNPEISEDFFFQKASFLARLGSGSACRSIQGPVVVWGSNDSFVGSSDLIGIQHPYELHSVFKTYQDTILLVDKGEKQVSSTAGHDLMYSHPFAEKRFEQAHQNLDKLKQIFKVGNLDEFIAIVESEALTLHAMMMTSYPYFILMKPNTLEIINRIWEYRIKCGSKVCFTLDAGANVHVLYPEHEKTSVLEFIKNELIAFCQNGQYICDQVGSGAKKL